MAASLAETLSNAAHGLLSIQWLEEGLIILSIGLAFILAHSGFKTAELKKGHWDVKMNASEEVSACRSHSVHKVRAGTALSAERRACANTCRTPQTSAEMPGVTDARFLGRIISYKEHEGYGFISCRELYPRFQRDVFLHRFQVGAFGVGDAVSFGVFLNKNGQPQAKELALAAPCSPRGDAACLGIACKDDVPSPQEGGDLQAKPSLNPYAKPFLGSVSEKQALNPFAKPFQLSQAAVAAPTVPPSG
mmetsp:Transcript_144384/g.402241  ORF Transcript_144384/g.402241 Transcript_144384/m.402241 type:complete len:248 (-) Transcript_144384:45-788(-)